MLACAFWALLVGLRLDGITRLSAQRRHVSLLGAVIFDVIARCLCPFGRVLLPELRFVGNYSVWGDKPRFCYKGCTGLGETGKTGD